jgi:hypothetical protein
MSRKANNHLCLLLGIFLMLSAMVPGVNATLSGLDCESPAAAPCCSNDVTCCHIDEPSDRRDAHQAVAFTSLAQPAVIPAVPVLAQPLSIEVPLIPIHPPTHAANGCVGLHPARAPPVR